MEVYFLLKFSNRALRKIRNLHNCKNMLCVLRIASITATMLIEHMGTAPNTCAFISQFVSMDTLPCSLRLFHSAACIHGSVNKKTRENLSTYSRINYNLKTAYKMKTHITWRRSPHYWLFMRGITGHRWIPSYTHTKVSNAKLWYFLLAQTSCQTNSLVAVHWRRARAINVHASCRMYTAWDTFY